MGALTPVLGGLTSLTATLGAASQVVGAIQTLSGNSAAERAQELQLRQLQERQRLQQQQLAQDNALERERIALQSAQDEEDRRNALRRAVSRQRATFGGRGISANSGSSQAVLLGLMNETEDELAQREQLDNLRNRALDLEAGQTRSLNLLQATQLQQRNALNDLF